MVIGVLAWVGYGSFVAARELTDGGTTSADPAEPNETKGPPAPEHVAIGEERTKPRFEGEVLGIYLGPDLAKAPAGAVERNEQLKAGWINCDNVTHRPVETAQTLGLEFNPPPGFELTPYQVHALGVTSAVGICATTGEEVVAAWEYTTNFNNSYGRVNVARTFPMTVYQLDVAADRVSTIVAGGQEAILIAPVNAEDGYGSFAIVMFPRDNAFTYILTNNVPEKELLAMADAVGESLSKAPN
jgi:hypothetical protein